MNAIKFRAYSFEYIIFSKLADLVYMYKIDCVRVSYLCRQCVISVTDRRIKHTRRHLKKLEFKNKQYNTDMNDFRPSQHKPVGSSL